MAKGVYPIGIKQEAVESAPGIYNEDILVRNVPGDLQYKPVRWTEGELNQDMVKANHQLSIMGDEALMDDFSRAAYVVWQNQRWTVTNVSYVRPRINLTLGGIYNG